MSLVVGLSACTHVPLNPPPAPAPPPPPPRQEPKPAPAPAQVLLPTLGPNGLPAPRTPRSPAELRLEAARRLVAANPQHSHLGKPQDILLAIPVLEVELNADGSIKRINVLRKPGQAPETLQIAIDAVNRAAPYGDVSRLPKPWAFVETFLFNNDRKFKPRTLDDG